MSTVFVPQPLPRHLATRVAERVRAAHGHEPFSPLDPRSAVRRLATLLDDLELTTAVFRGGLDLRGAEVDHVWLAVGTADRSLSVLDIAFPLFDEGFVGVLRRFVAGDAEPEELAAAAEGTAIEARVIGAFPDPIRYRGEPIWGER